MAEFSIRRRLLGLVLGAVGMAWLAMSVAAYFDAHREADRLLDAHLAQVTGILVAGAGHEMLELDPDDLAEFGRDATFDYPVTFQVWRDGQLVVSSRGAPRRPLAVREQGFSDATAAGRRWRVFSTWDSRHRYRVEVAEEHAIRDRIARHLAQNALLPLALGLPVLGLLIWWGIGRGLRPLVLLGEEVASRDALALEPVGLTGGTAETAPVVERLNALFARIRHSTELERRFTADASHELRQPVAAVRAQAEVARTTPNPATRDAALAQVIRASDRMSSMLDQLLTLARLERDGSGAGFDEVDLAAVARLVIAELAPAALEQHIEIGLEAGGSTLVRGKGPLLAVLVRNLVSNAIHHGRSDVTVVVAAGPGGPALTVVDRGPGVPDTERAQLGARFFRGSTAGGAGSGLGLSIVRRIAELHGATLEFCPAQDGTGLAVRVGFPA